MTVEMVSLVYEFGEFELVGDEGGVMSMDKVKFLVSKECALVKECALE